jgi:hypothetical protein
LAADPQEGLAKTLPAARNRDGGMKPLDGSVHLGQLLRLPRSDGGWFPFRRLSQINRYPLAKSQKRTLPEKALAGGKSARREKRQEASPVGWQPFLYDPQDFLSSP